MESVAMARRGWFLPSERSAVEESSRDWGDHQYPNRRIERMLEYLIRKVERMAVDQATFDAALAAFLTDLQAGLDAIAAKIAAEAPAVDLSAELAQVQSAQATFDAAVAADTAPPAPAA
jgi:hypothetical protein